MFTDMVHFKTARNTSFTLIFGVFLTPSVYAADAAHGLELAEQWCTACNFIGEGEARMEDAGPMWPEIAEHEQEALLAALDTPHDFMPEFPTLTDADKADLVAYIKSLAKN